MFSGKSCIGIAVMERSGKKIVMSSLLEGDQTAAIAGDLELNSVSSPEILMQRLEQSVRFEKEENELQGTAFKKAVRKRLKDSGDSCTTEISAILDHDRPDRHLTHLIALSGDIYEFSEFCEKIGKIVDPGEIESVLILTAHGDDKCRYDWVVFSGDAAPERYRYTDPDNGFPLSVFRRIADGKIRGDSLENAPEMQAEIPEDTIPEEVLPEDGSAERKKEDTENKDSPENKEDEFPHETLFPGYPAGIVSFFADGCIFRVNVEVKLGTGQVFNYGFPHARNVSESVKSAYLAFREASETISQRIDCRAYDYTIRYECISDQKKTAKLSIPTLIALCSANLQRAVEPSLLVMAELTPGNAEAAKKALKDAVAKGKENGFTKLLLPGQGKRGTGAGGKLEPVFYRTAAEAVRLAVGIDDTDFA